MRGFLVGAMGFAATIFLLVVCATPPDLRSAQGRVNHCTLECFDRGGLRYVDFGVPEGEICKCWEDEE